MVVEMFVLGSNGCGRFELQSSFAGSFPKQVVGEGVRVRLAVGFVGLNLSHCTEEMKEGSKGEDLNSFRRTMVQIVGMFISFLDRTRTGHDCFRRGVVTPHQQQQQQRTHETESVEEKLGSVPRVYCPKLIQRLPHLPHNHQVKNGSIDRKELPKMINFAAVASLPNSFMSSLTGDTDSLQHSMSSAFQITNPSSAGRPPLSKRKCSSMDDAVAKCGASSGRCHCSKKMKLKVKRVVRVPAISVKLANIPSDDYSERKYGQKPIKGSPHPSDIDLCTGMNVWE
ncbi:probable WRKY transcription factor 7 [Camellia sinensis]|uniref:probable WRKY transcription factor 7 n=1 Tax=Camellia sinensis TaxID=4442 RepID=UPI001035606E|nr:probable WRKY transcription factor 7 [Camellia sinensis]